MNETPGIAFSAGKSVFCAKLPAPSTPRPMEPVDGATAATGILSDNIRRASKFGGRVSDECGQKGLAGAAR